ncbi:MAG TPA: hypothetical protein VEF72_19655 [Mycobacterium sp.]|nr:hypothetical protein [Mycobacterium sp.]
MACRSVIDNPHADLVSVTKYRRLVFTDRMLTRWEHLMHTVCADTGVEQREFQR